MIMRDVKDDLHLILDEISGILADDEIVAELKPSEYKDLDEAWNLIYRSLESITFI